MQFGKHNCPGEAGEKGKRALTIPKAFANQKRVVAYLTKTRKMPASLVVELIREGLLYQDDQGNCVFPCLDESGQVRGAILEGTLSEIRWKGRATGSDVSYPWWWPPQGGEGESDLVTVTESPIDAMSLATLRPGCRAGHIIALGGLCQNAVNSFLERVKARQVVIAVDNGLEWQGLAKKLLEAISGRGIKCWNLVPEKKDWGEMLIGN